VAADPEEHVTDEKSGASNNYGLGDVCTEINIVELVSGFRSTPRADQEGCWSEACNADKDGEELT
jgi:hypothetical protein